MIVQRITVELEMIREWGETVPVVRVEAEGTTTQRIAMNGTVGILHVYAATLDKASGTVSVSGSVSAPDALTAALEQLRIAIEAAHPEPKEVQS